MLPLLRVAQFVAGQQHRHALREQQRGDEVPLLPLAQRDDVRVVGRPFGAAVPAVVVVGAVAVVLAVGLVVLVVVADQVVQREAVVAGDEVDAGVRPPAAPCVQVAGAAEPRGELADGAAVALPEPADAVAVLAVPLGPQRPGSCRPGSRPAPTSHGSAISFTCDRIGSWWMMSKNAPSLSTSYSSRASVLARSKRKPSTCISVHPVAQAVHDELQHARVLHVERVAAAGEVHVVARVFGRQAVVAGVVDAAEATASAPAGCPRRCGCRPRRGSPRCRRRAARGPSS